MSRAWKSHISKMAVSLLFIAAASVVAPPVTHALNPNTMSFQGKVVNANGTNVANGNYSFVFKLYTVSTAGTAIWTETQTTVTVSNGIFQVNLGSVCPLFTANACNNNTPVDFNASNSIFLGITFNGDAAGEMTPRVQMQSVPYAFNSDKVGGFSASQLVQLSPAGQQSGFINVSGNGTYGGNLSVTGTYNGNVLSGSTLTFSSATANSINGATNQTLIVQSQGTGQLMLNSASGSLGLSSTTNTLQRTAAGSTTVDLQDSTANTVLALTNSDATRVANLTVEGTVTAGVGLTVTAGGVTITAGGLNVSSTGINNAGSIAGATTITASSTLTLSGTAANQLAVTGTPPVIATSSLIIVGSPIAGGDATTTTGGTYIGLNTAATGAGSAADFINFQNNGTSRFRVTNAGIVTATTGYSVNGSASLTRSCGAAQFIGSAVVSGGIYVSGVCTNDGLSDGRLKTDVASLDSSVLERVSRINTVNFNFDCNNEYFTTSQTGCNPELQTGVIAQELAALFPELVKVDDYGYFNVDYQGLSVTTLKAVSQLAKFVDANGNANLSNLNASSGISTPNLFSDGALALNSGTNSSVEIDSGIEGSVYIGDKTATTVSIGRNGSSVNIKGALTVDEASRFKGPVALNFASGTGLAITGDLNGNVTGLLITAKPSESTGQASGIKIEQSALSGSNGLDDALVIDNKNSNLKISSAINISNSGGAGYANIITSENYNVNGAGDVQTAGAIRSTSFLITDASGTQVATINNRGDATFTNINLNDAILRGGLTVAGDSNFAGLTTFQKLATFIGKTIFRQDVQFDGHIAVSNDTAGYATIRTGEKLVHVKFFKAYPTPPVISLNITNGQFGLSSVSNVTKEGFDIMLHSEPASEVTFAWTALEVLKPSTARNPLDPTTVASPIQ